MEGSMLGDGAGEPANFFLRNIHPISSDPGCDMVPKDELDMDSSNKRKVSHYLAGKICGHEIGIKWKRIDWVVESWLIIYFIIVL